MLFVELRIGNGGWCRVEGLDLPGAVYLRVQEAEGRLRITELYVDGRGAPIAAAGLRRLPLAALEEWAAGGRTTEERLHVAGPDLSRLAAYFATTFGKVKRAHWVEDSWRAQYDKGSNVRADVPQAPMPRERTRRHDEEVPFPTLDAPTEGLTDDYLRAVSTAYHRAVAHRLPPAETLGHLANVSPRTVHRWVYTARKRGLMPPAGSRGRIV